MQAGNLAIDRRTGSVTWAGLAMILLLASCNADSVDALSGEWLIDRDEVIDGGPGKDGIPALTNPPMVDASAIDYLQPDDLVIGYRVDSDIRAYPHRILDWHEIANVEIDGEALAVTYCPLTGSALAWNRIISGDETTFGVSGFLYRNNLMPYDRATDSYWSQMRMDAVSGDLIETRAEVYQILETTWQTWQLMYPDSRVANNSTGIYGEGQYDIYPYGGYKSNSYTLQPIDDDLKDGRLHAKERVTGVISGSNARVYSLSSFADSVRVVHDGFGGDSLVVVGQATDNFIMVFKRELLDGTVLKFRPAQNRYPVVMVDQEGNDWDLFGRAVSGPRAGEHLSHPVTFTAYWFAWYLFYPDPEIFEYTSG